MDVESRNKEKQEILSRYFETDRKLKLAQQEIDRLTDELKELRSDLESKDEKIQSLLSHINQ